MKFTHADGKFAQVTLDPFGRPLAALDENGIETRWSYTGSGDIKTITRAANKPDATVTTFFYDERGDLSLIVTPNGGGAKLDYLRYGPDGEPVTPAIYEGQVTRITYPDHTSEFFGYYRPDGSRDAGELEWYRKPDGSIVRLAYDSQHRVKQIDYPGSVAGAPFTVAYDYDEFGRVKQSTKSDVAEGAPTRYEYDSLNRITKITPPPPWKEVTFAYATDAALRWITQVTVAGIGTYVYREDTKGRLSEVVSPVVGGGATPWVFQYDLDGKNLVTQHPNGPGGAGAREERTYTTNGRDWLSEITLYNANNVLQDRFSYGYGNAGELLSETDNGARVHAFVYDNLYRLQSETHPDFGIGGLPGTIEYFYDPNGNRTKRIVNGGVAPNGYTDHYFVDGRDRLWWVNRRTDGAATSRPPSSGQAAPYTIYHYDVNGRVIYRERRHDATPPRKLTFLWDGDDRLKQVWQDNGGQLTIPFTGLYDEEGLRIRKTETWAGLNGGAPLTHDYSWGPGGVVHDTANGGTTYTPGLHQRQGTTDRFYHTGTGLNLPSSLRYDAFGNRSATGR